MPKDAKKNVDRYKIRGGDLNVFEFQQNQESLKEWEAPAQAPAGFKSTAKPAKGVTASKSTKKAVKESSKKTAKNSTKKATKKSTKKAAKK